MDALSDIDESRRDTLFECLSAPVRQHVVSYLGERRESSLDDVAAAVAETAESDRRTAQLTIGLHHNHLPKLESAGLLSYDPRSGTVTATEHTEEAVALVETVEEWSDLRAAVVGADDAGRPSNRVDHRIQD